MIALSPRKPRPRRRSFLWLILAAFALAARCAPAQAVPPWSADAEKAWWAQNPTPDKWDAAAKTLDAQLGAVYAHDHQSVFSSTDFQGWMELLEWVRLGQADAPFLADPKHLAAFVALAQDDAISHLLVQKMEPEDSPTGALENIVALEEANAADLHEYAALGVAYALVFDVPFPADWPHSQVSQSAVPIGDVDVPKRFAYYVAANRDHKLENDLTQLPFEDLKFLVASEVKLSELDYGQSKTDVPYDQFDKAFFKITYDTNRIGSGNLQFMWKEPTYLLQDIEKDGGICVDQAYYAAMLGKARGIPTIYFHGFGDEGGHAWFGYLRRDGTWALDCGRYANQNFPKGFAVDPQTWKDIKDTALEDYVKNIGSSPNYQPARNALDWAWLHPADPAAARQAYDDARAIMPEYSESWTREGDLLAHTQIPLDDLKAFYDAWTRQFGNYPDMKVDGQQRLLAALKAANDPEATDVERDIVLANRSSGVDLSVQGSFSAIADKLKAEDWDGAKLEFGKAVRDFSAQGGSTFIYDVVTPYIEGCIDHGRFDQAADGLKFLEDRMTISGDILTQAMADLHGEIDALRPLPDLATSWLQELDQGNESQAWQDGCKLLQQTSQDEWTTSMRQRRDSLGACQGRELIALRRYRGSATIAGEETKLVLVQARFRSTFGNNVVATEKMMFCQDPDGHYRPLDYHADKESAATAGP